jgi:hypothetical protein
MSTKPPKKVLFAPTSPEEKALFTRFCKKAKECERGAECVFAHTYEALNPVLCAHERAKGGCTRQKECQFMHTNETKYEYVMRACQEDLKRLGIDLDDSARIDSPSPMIKIGISTRASETAVAQFKSAYAELCEKTKAFKESWADIDEEERKYQQSEEQLRLDPEFTDMSDYNSRTLYRLWGDGTLMENKGDGIFKIIQKGNPYEVLAPLPQLNLKCCPECGMGCASPVEPTDTTPQPTKRTTSKNKKRLLK